MSQGTIEITVKVYERDDYDTKAKAEGRMPLGVDRNLLCEVAKGLVNRVMDELEKGAA